MDKALTAEQVAHNFGFPANFVREACNRESNYHPLPHIKRGGSRPVCYVRPSTFERWLDEEEKLTVGLEVEELGTPDEYVLPGYHEVLKKLEAVFDSFENGAA